MSRDDLDHVEIEAEWRFWFIHDDLGCVGCQTNLRSLVGPVVVCPECGQLNDLARPELWRRVSLPLGMREGRQLPAHALVLALVLPIGIWICVAMFRTGKAELYVQVGVWAGTMVMMGFWVKHCWRWLGTCDSKKWGWGLLITLHVCAYLSLLGPAWALGSFRSTPRYWACCLPVLGFSGFIWAIYHIKRGTGQARFRPDWLAWRRDSNFCGIDADDDVNDQEDAEIEASG